MTLGAAATLARRQAPARQRARRPPRPRRPRGAVVAEDRACSHALVAMDDLARGDLGAAGALAQGTGRVVGGEARAIRWKGSPAPRSPRRSPRTESPAPSRSRAALAGCDAARFAGEGASGPDARALAASARAAIEALERARRAP